MPTDDRDAMFEKALARQLRASASGDLRGAAANCPEAEILAGYHERSLAAAEMAECATHVSGCARCREILSLLEATREVPFGALAQEPGEPARDFGAPPIRMPAPKQASRRAMRYWAAPLGAMAAGLLLLIAVNHLKEAHLNQKATSEVALHREYPPIADHKAPAAVTGAEKVASASPAAGAKSRQDFEKESTGRDEKSQAKEPPALHSKAPRAMTPRPPKAEAEVAVGGGSVGGILSGSGRGIGPGTAGAKIVPPASTTESVEVTAAAPAINSVTNAAPAAPPPRVPSVTQTVTVEEAAPLQRKAQSEITADTSSAQTLAIDGRNVADLMLLTPGTGLPISAPGGNILWRAGRGGRVLNSRDSGAHWKKQKSHVKVDLSNGSAPSAEVCWMVGSAGTILRTVDGGAHWKKVTSPMAGEIAGISAADAQHAAVWDANKTNTFVTADGGISWSTVAK